jgi:hypothetical protein
MVIWTWCTVRMTLSWYSSVHIIQRGGNAFSGSYSHVQNSVQQGCYNYCRTLFSLSRHWLIDSPLVVTKLSEASGKNPWTLDPEDDAINSTSHIYNMYCFSDRREEASWNLEKWFCDFDLLSAIHKALMSAIPSLMMYCHSQTNFLWYRH